jgi:ribosomal protein S12 methylthiotransferase
VSRAAAQDQAARRRPGIDRLVGVFDREHIVEAVRGRRTRGRSTGTSSGKYSRPLARPCASARRRCERQGDEDDAPARLRDDRARLRLTPRHYAFLRMSEGATRAARSARSRRSAG